MAKSNTESTTKTNTVTYDLAEQLRTPEEMAAYLNAWLVEVPEDSAGIARALGAIARAKGMSQATSIIELCTFSTKWSSEDAEHIGLCAEFPSLSWLAPTAEEALSGIRKVVSDVLADMATTA